MSGSSLEDTDAFHYELVRLLSPSSFEVKNDGRRAKNTSLVCLRIYSHPVTGEDHVLQNCRGAPGGQNRDIHLTFSGPRLQHAIGATSRLPSLAPLRCARQLSDKLWKFCARIMVTIFVYYGSTILENVWKSDHIHVLWAELKYS